MNVIMHACMHVRKYIYYNYVCMYVRKYVCMYVCTYACIYIAMCICVCKFASMHLLESKQMYFHIKRERKQSHT